LLMKDEAYAPGVQETGLENERPRVDYRLFLSTLIMAAELAAGLICGSLSLVALAIVGGIDLVKLLVRLISLSRSTAPPPGKSYFGFSQWPATGGVAGGLLFILAGSLVLRAAGSTLEAALPAGNYYPAIAVLAVSLVALYFISAGKPLKNPGGTTGRYFRMGLVLSLVVLGELLIAQFGRFQSLDPVISIFIALFVLGKSVQWILESIKALLDTRLPQNEREWIEGLVREFAGTHFRLHDLQARKKAGSRWIDFHLAIADSTPVEEAFHLANMLEKKLIEKIPESVIIIHVDAGA
jgi:cation diffusion facilitator family transporter